LQINCGSGCATSTFLVVRSPPVAVVCASVRESRELSKQARKVHPRSAACSIFVDYKKRTTVIEHIPSIRELFPFRLRCLLNLCGYPDVSIPKNLGPGFGSLCVSNRLLRPRSQSPECNTCLWILGHGGAQQGSSVDGLEDVACCSSRVRGRRGGEALKRTARPFTNSHSDGDEPASSKFNSGPMDSSSMLRGYHHAAHPSILDFFFLPLLSLLWKRSLLRRARQFLNFALLCVVVSPAMSSTLTTWWSPCPITILWSLRLRV